MGFETMGLRQELLDAIREQGYTEPTPIQEQAIPEILAGRDLIGCAQTGTGKTAAFALPILERLARKERAPLRVLVLVPTRELAIQVGRSFRELSEYLGLVSATAFGGVPIEPQEMMLRHGAEVLVATPGRLKDHIWRMNIDFRNIECLVLDEADRMLDMGFIKDVRGIIELLPAQRQSMLFSATVDQQIMRFASGILTDPVRIEVSPPASTLEEVDQYLVRTERGRKGSTLERLIRRHDMKRAIVFAKTKSGASRLASRLRERGLKATAIHSNRTQEERVRALEGFREGRIHLLIATDIAARGIDVQDVSHVINFDLPFTAKDYVHRIGRTARAGRRGTALSLVTPEDERGVAAIERLISKRLSWLGEDPPPRGSRDEGRAEGVRERRPRGAGRPPSGERSRRDGPRGSRDEGRSEGVRRRSGSRGGRSRSSRGAGEREVSREPAITTQRSGEQRRRPRARRPESGGEARPSAQRAVARRAPKSSGIVKRIARRLGMGA